MRILLGFFLAQGLVAAAVIFVLKRVLDKELMKAALEQLESGQIPSATGEIVVRFSAPVSDEFKNHLESIRRRRFTGAKVDFRRDAGLKGGVVIEAGEILLDFSLAGRLRDLGP
jgi:F0F1-type ATP synthase delta subunit